MLRLNQPLLTEISASASESGLPIAAEIRRILVVWATERTARRDQQVVA